MNKFLLTLVTGGLVFAAGLNTAVAQDDDDSASAVEFYTCSYVDGKGAADLDKVIVKWNKWADDQGLTDYSAWTLTPFYAGPEQDFDVIWMGVTETGKGMGDVQDMWLANSGTLDDEFDSVSPCDSHSLAAAVQFKAPPEREDPSSIIIDFSDCIIGEGKHFSTDVAPALRAWGEFRAGHGSTAGMWALFPVYGGDWNGDGHVPGVGQDNRPGHRRAQVHGSRATGAGIRARMVTRPSQRRCHHHPPIDPWLDG